VLNQPGSSQAYTVYSLLSERARNLGSKSAYTFLKNGEGEERSVTYGQLDLEARALAVRILRDAEPGDRALVLADDNDNFVRAFMACQYAGVIAVPVCPPVPIQSERRVAGLRAIASDCAAALVLSSGTAEIREVAPELAARSWIAVDEVGTDLAADFRPVSIDPDDLSFLQYTSGSTSSPKGVMVTHRSLMFNEELFSHCFSLSRDDVIVSWLPLYHDMGLIGMVLQTLHLGAHAVLMSPLSFIQRPARWLRALTRYRGTMTGAPNFAYELCLRRIPPQDRAEFDLSSLHCAFSGAEPINAAIMVSFADGYRASGLDRNAMAAGYGLAEVTLVASASAPGAFPPCVRVQAEALRRGKVTAGNDRTLVSVGRPQLHRRVEVVDPVTHEPCADGNVGEIWLSGPDVAVGYWRRPDETARIFGAHLAGSGDGPFLRTGDTGVRYRGELFVTGRLKDLIIVGGLNHYPQDIELTVESAHEWIRPGFTAVFAREPSDGRNAGQEQVVAVAEVQRPRNRSGEMPGREDLALSVRTAVSLAHGIQLHDILLVVAGAVPRTTSGKIQRTACRDYYERSELVLARLPAARELKDMP